MLQSSITICYYLSYNRTLFLRSILKKTLCEKYDEYSSYNHHTNETCRVSLSGVTSSPIFRYMTHISSSLNRLKTFRDVRVSFTRPLRVPLSHFTQHTCTQPRSKTLLPKDESLRGVCPCGTGQNTLSKLPVVRMQACSKNNIVIFFYCCI